MVSLPIQMHAVWTVALPGKYLVGKVDYSDPLHAVEFPVQPPPDCQRSTLIVAFGAGLLCRAFPPTLPIADEGRSYKNTHPGITVQDVAHHSVVRLQDGIQEHITGTVVIPQLYKYRLGDLMLHSGHKTVEKSLPQEVCHVGPATMEVASVGTADLPFPEMLHQTAYVGVSDHEASHDDNESA